MRYAPIAAALCLTAAGPALAQPQPISPGYWETTNEVLSPMHSSKTEKRCIRPADVTKFMEGQINHIYRCTYPTKVIQDGQIHMKGSCKTRDGAPMPIEGDGTYSSDAFHMEARGVITFGPVKVAAHATTDAHRVGDVCPAPEPAAAPAPAADAGNGGNGQ